MIRIYFDWNVMAGFRAPNISPYSEILEEIERHRDSLIIPYSPAHIRDLSKGLDGTQEKELLIRNDLRLISTLTSNRFICQYWKASSVQPSTIHPEEYFDDSKHDISQSLTDLFDFDTLFEGLDPTGELRKEFDGIMNTRFETDFPYQMPDSELAKFNVEVPQIRKGQTYGEFMKVFAKYMNALLTDPEVYGNHRRIIFEGFHLDPKVISNHENVFHELDKHLPNTMMGKSFSEILEETANAKEAHSNNRKYDYFMSTYSQLDAFGFHPEKLSKKNTHENLTTDALHAFYAAHCDFFVTNDKKAAEKARAVYNRYGIKAEILKPMEFLPRLKELTVSTESEMDFFNRLITSVKGCLERGECKYDEDKPYELRTYTCFLPIPMLNYFNYCLWGRSRYGSLFFLLDRVPRHYGEFIYTDEVARVIERLVKFFGMDDDSRELFNYQEEHTLIEENKWPGRTWTVGTTAVSAFFSKGTFQLLVLPFSASAEK